MNLHLQSPDILRHFDTARVYDAIEMMYVKSADPDEYNKYISYMQSPKSKFDEYVQML